MLPLSFKEYLDFYENNDNKTMDEIFKNYLTYGGMPSIFEFENNYDRISDLLEGIYSTVILKDVIQRNNIYDQMLLKKIVMFLADNVGNITSANNIGNYLTSQKEIENTKKAPAQKTVENYIQSLENAYIFYNIKRYDIKGKQYLKTLNKYYIVDLGIRNMLLGLKDIDRGHILENVIYFELLRRGYRVDIGKIGEKEIDFIATKIDDKKYIQVTETLLGEETRKREITPLKEIKDNYEKIVLSMDRSIEKFDEGIKIVNIIDFLLEK